MGNENYYMPSKLADQITDLLSSESFPGNYNYNPERKYIVMLEPQNLNLPEGEKIYVEPFGRADGQAVRTRPLPKPGEDRPGGTQRQEIEILVSVWHRPEGMDTDDIDRVVATIQKVIAVVQDAYITTLGERLAGEDSDMYRVNRPTVALGANGEYFDRELLQNSRVCATFIYFKFDVDISKD